MAFEKYARASDHTMAPAIVLSLLAPFLPPQQLQEAVKAARATSNPALRGRSLAMIAPHLPPDQCSMVLKEALEVARKIKDTDRFEVLAQVALRLPSDQRQTILAETLEAAEKVKDIAHDLEPTLAELAPYLSPDLCASVLALARKMRSAYVLAALGPYVPAKERQEVLDEALAIAKESRAAGKQAHVLALLIPQLPIDRRQEILKVALADMQQIRFPVNWKLYRQTLWSLASAWAQLPLQQAYALWGTTLHEYAKHRQTHFLAELSGLLPVIVAFDGVAALTETPGQSHLNLGTETRSLIEIVQLTIPESIDAFRKSIEKLDAIALTETIHAVLEICRQWSWLYSSPQRRD